MLTLFYGGFTQAHTFTNPHTSEHFNVTYWLALIPLTNHIHIIDELSPDMTQKTINSQSLDILLKAHLALKPASDSSVFLQ